MPFSEEEVIRILVNIMLALKELHDKGIQHRDIKAENILVFKEEGELFLLKLADFGLS